MKQIEIYYRISK